MQITERYAEAIRSPVLPQSTTHIGDTHGRLTVLYASTERQCSKVKWVCRCSCGNLALVVWKNASSCGCLMQEKANAARRVKRSLSRAAVLDIRQSGDKHRIIAERHGCSISTVSLVKSGSYYADIR